ncbi:serine/threonine-protein phosphatase [Petralouisia muris]|uniref:Serine/threonine-protein phosphatase n=1 Tax=Petralouisia muris TaxID=3032872 RepID=A0AC61S0C8_9FIRM|nr:protein phosphatase 2C domain-containing protein [Petralouisia muris]TGY97787.1 serine/threonine-protein phosphatase [Petralouisia muris]
MVTYEILSEPGEREYNEDYAGARQNGEAFCFVLADGLGGHGGGDEASRMVAEYILNDFEKKGEASEEYLRECFEESQKLLMEEQEKQNRLYEMKTTLVVLLADEHILQWGHIGDSRLYFYRNKKLKQRTLDHSVPQMLVAAGEIREEDIRGHADRNRLLRVMGSEWDHPRYQLSPPVERSGQEAFLLCSDGFWEWIEEKPMQAALKRAKSPAEWLEQMQKTVQKNGTGKGMDNYSAIAVFAD